MSSYPPPPPPFDRGAARAQQRAWKAQQRVILQQQRAQQRWQRSQMKAQMRMQRRRSLVGPLMLIAIGVVVLMTRFGSLHWGQFFEWYSRWWPAVMILAGLVLVAEWSLGHNREQPYSTPRLGGGMVVLLILLVSFGASLRWVGPGREWSERFMGSDWDHMMGQSHDFDDTLTQSITPQQTLVIRNPRGNVTVTGSSEDGQVHLALHKQVYAWRDSDAESRAQDLQPGVTNTPGQLLLAQNDVEGGTLDMTVEVPHGTPVTIDAGRGDVSIQELHSAVEITASRGAVDVSAITGPVSIHTSYDDASISGHSISGPVTLQGHAGDLTFSDITGGLSLDGDFFGRTHVERVNGIVRFETSRTKFQMARLDGDLDLDGGSDLSASEILGPVTLSTRNRNITLDRVDGRITVKNRNGSVNVTNTTPIAGIEITNEKGSIDIGVPQHASFNLKASTRRGDIENDFGLANSGPDSQPTLSGTVAGGGGLISVSTTDGDITLRKATVAPLPPAPPAAPKLTTEPIAPVQPALPGKPKAPKAPTLHKPPTAPIPAQP
ncbi:MAG: DUF4097 family beta strand repeat-containing protein [Acidobacteriaceae bacterium]|nr:DUF4097 family beta strand repeat-containing protein [Acidobacteriaceae bacterium]